LFSAAVVMSLKSPLPKNLRDECDKAARTLREFTMSVTERGVWRDGGAGDFFGVVWSFPRRLLPLSLTRLPMLPRAPLVGSPNAKSGPDKVIPSTILVAAQGIAILTVFRAGFLVSVRAGSGVVFSRTGPNQWSAPSCVGIGGISGGLEIGAELTDFVIILNSKGAVDSFKKGTNVTLGGNLSVAAG